MPIIGNRFRRRHQHTARLHPAAIVGICLATAILVTVIIGNLLKIWLDDETYRKLTEGEETETQTDGHSETPVRNINAYPFLLGADTGKAVGQTAVAVPINTPDGVLLYTSDVGTYLGFTGDTDVSLEQLSELNAYVPYVSGVFYPQAFLQELPDVRYVAANEEGALLREFLNAGGSEILLMGLPLNTPNLDAVTEYVKAVKFAVGNAPVGIAVPFAIATEPANWELLSTLEPLCDFFAVDLTAQSIDKSDLDDTGISPTAAARLADCAYLISQYDARLLFCETQDALISTAITQNRPDFEVIKSFPQKAE